MLSWEESERDEEAQVWRSGQPHGGNRPKSALKYSGLGFSPVTPCLMWQSAAGVHNTSQGP